MRLNYCDLVGETSIYSHFFPSPRSLYLSLLLFTSHSSSFSLPFSLALSVCLSFFLSLSLPFCLTSYCFFWMSSPLTLHLYLICLTNFLIPAILFFSLMGWFTAYFIPTAAAKATPDKVRESGYLSKLEGRHGHIRTKEEHAIYVADCEANNKPIW